MGNYGDISASEEENSLSILDKVANFMLAYFINSRMVAIGLTCTENYPHTPLFFSLARDDCDWIEMFKKNIDYFTSKPLNIPSEHPPI